MNALRSLDGLSVGDALGQWSFFEDEEEAEAAWMTRSGGPEFSLRIPAESRLLEDKDLQG